ncbi:MAG: LysR family transcriptional regulator [Gammaproteobacteria bacterium]|nr:MAG: LysR family transcriptional regulator [Gammaproteobacteria bacterium]UCH38438.1 MAG: LysR family transcriptional regulator [Gammaproteobacteria bacterium]
MYDWDDLRYFLELSRQGKLVRAAARLHVDHTTVSRRITALEKQLDVRLFDKSPNGYQLTDAGLRLLPLAEQIETQSNRLYQDIAGKDARLGGTVRLATPEALGSQVIARHVTAFRREHPDIEIELVAETRRMSLSKREADIAISFSRPESGRLIAWKLCDYRLRIYGSRDYLAAHAPINKPEELAGHNFVSYIDDLIEMPELRFFDNTIKNARVVFRSTNVSAQFNAILDGIGLGLVHCFMARDEPRLQVILPEQISVERTYWLLVHEDLRHVARVDAVCKFLTGILGHNPALMMGD